jgi:hypothetical protein
MSKVFINVPNNSVEIDSFSSTLEEFLEIEPNFLLQNGIIEIEYNSDTNLRQCIKDAEGNIQGISEELKNQLKDFIDNIPQYQEALEILRMPLPAEFIRALEDKIRDIKSEAGKRILHLYPQYKQNNLLGAVSLIHSKEMVAIKNDTMYVLSDDEKSIIDNAKACNDYLTSIRGKSKNLETLVNQKTTIEELEVIDVSNNIYWE